MELRILSVNVGSPATIGVQHGAAVISAIGKKPVAALMIGVGRLGLEGDTQFSTEFHGGPDKAVYAYPADHWTWWEGEHGIRCRPATFGENLTIEGADETHIAIGDRFRFGDCLLEVSEPRAPCYKFAIHTGRPDAPFLMTTSGRTGWYMRVLEAGRADLRPAMLHVDRRSGGPSVRETFFAAKDPKAGAELRARVAAEPALGVDWRSAVLGRESA